jgi:small subunit ribosomal protein S6
LLLHNVVRALIRRRIGGEKSRREVFLMATYESTIICSPELPAEKIDELAEKIKKVIEVSQGQILITQQLGKKRLAYPINKHREGNYVYFEFAGPGETVKALENFFKVNDTVIRYLTVKAGKKKPAKPAPELAAEESNKQFPEEVKTDESAKPSVAGAE